MANCSNRFLINEISLRWLGDSLDCRSTSIMDELCNLFVLAGLKPHIAMQSAMALQDVIDVLEDEKNPCWGLYPNLFGQIENRVKDSRARKIANQLFWVRANDGDKLFSDKEGFLKEHKELYDKKEEQKFSEKISRIMGRDWSEKYSRDIFIFAVYYSDRLRMTC